MLREMNIRTKVLAIHGVSAICLGLAFLYLRSTMTDLLVEVFAIVIAIMLSAAALLVAALTDWFAAFGQHSCSSAMESRYYYRHCCRVKPPESL